MLEVADALRSVLAFAKPLHPSPDELRLAAVLDLVLAAITDKG